VLLDAMRSYFNYDMETECGIPAIALEGTPEDWQAIADRAEQFASLDLEWWLQPLRVILRQFVTAAQGIIDRPFWQSLYKYQHESGGPIITGWISALFPYLTDSRTGLAIHRNPYLTLDSQRLEEIGFDEEIDEETDDIDIEEDDEDIDKSAKDVATPSPPKQLNRLILRRNMEDPPGADINPKDVSHLGQPPENQPPRRIIPSSQEDMADTLGADPDLYDDFDEDYDDEYVIGAWLRPMPKRRRNDAGDYFGDGWGPRISDLPFGLSKAPFRWDYLKQSFGMEFLGGFVGVSQDKETLAVKPEIGWALREAPKRI
jgi:hypothetical protein